MASEPLKRGKVGLNDICTLLAGLHLAAAYVYGLIHWPFATFLVAAIYFMFVLHRLPEVES